VNAHVQRGLVSLALVCGSAVLPAVAVAYAPPAGFILDLVAARRIKHKVPAMRVTLKVTEYQGDVAQPSTDLVVTFRSGGRVRREWKDAQGVPHATVTDQARAVAVDGDKRTKGTAVPDLWDALWACGDDGGEKDAMLTRAKAAMEAWKVPDSPVAFSRTDGRVAWVIGAEGSAGQTPQVWVDKDDFLPLRFIREQDGQLVDVRYRQWRSAAGGEFFPGRVETYVGGKLVRVEEAVKVDVTPKVDERDFKLD
jgi:hypothetical protein